MACDITGSKKMPGVPDFLPDVALYIYLALDYEYYLDPG